MNTVFDFIKKAWGWAKPYTRKAWGALVGVLISWSIATIQNPETLDWIGQIPDIGPIPTNKWLLAAIPFITLWLVRERDERSGVDEAPAEV